MASWEAELAQAEALLQAGKLFEAVQRANASMELFEASVLSAASAAPGAQSPPALLKEPLAFLDIFEPKATAEQRDALRRMFAARGDILTGLGATKRASLEYACAARLGPEDPELAAKRARLGPGAAQDGAQGGQAAEAAKVPCHILTGFLGSGKTTLLNHILRENHGKRLAVIENEFGEVGIDDALVGGGAMVQEENIVEMNNGCICCTVRGDLIAGLKKIVRNAGKAGKPLDGVLIETTGLADPAPVAQTFFADDFVQQHCRLDGILTVVDARHVLEHLDEVKPEGVENEAVEQIAFADRVLLNKCDLVDEAVLAHVEKRIRAINEAVPIRRTVNSEVDMAFILGIQAFSLDKILEQEDGFLTDGGEHQHDERVTSVGLNVAGEVDEKKLNAWIGWLLKERGTDLFRSKGVLAVRGQPELLVFQAIHMLFASSPQRAWGPNEDRRCKMVFIGRNLDRQELTSGFMACMA